MDLHAHHMCNVANPPEVQNWHVPIALVDLVKIKDANWDILVTRVSVHRGPGDIHLSNFYEKLIQIIPHINGINHVARIAELADADDDLTQLCIEHLLLVARWRRDRAGSACSSSTLTAQLLPSRHDAGCFPV